jgi:hypothetical protein
MNLSMILFSCLWAGYWKEEDINGFKIEIRKFSQRFFSNPTFRERLEGFIAQNNSFTGLLDTLRLSKAEILQSIS